MRLASTLTYILQKFPYFCLTRLPCVYEIQLSCIWGELPGTTKLAAICTTEHSFLKSYKYFTYLFEEYSKENTIQ